jgi:hypothetical protein
MLLEGILKNTSEENIEYKTLIEALKLIHDIAIFVKKIKFINR